MMCRNSKLRRHVGVRNFFSMQVNHCKGVVAVQLPYMFTYIFSIKINQVDVIKV